MLPDGEVAGYGSSTGFAEGFDLVGPIVGSETLSRFYTLHVFVVPGLIIALLTVHLRLVLARGINEYPVAGSGVDPETYEEEYEDLLKKTGIRFFPDGADKDVIVSSLVITGIVCCAATTR